MIDEKKIEETAHEYSWFNSDDEEGQLSVKRAFKKGINWFLDNLWHNTSEVPDKRKYIIVEYSNKKVSRDAFAPYDIHWLYKDFTGEPWKQLIKNEKITRWLYIDDLFPKEGGNHD
ncbi:MAG: hypothetical protein ACLT4A_11180 [Anaerobutyricum soehngenii]